MTETPQLATLDELEELILSQAGWRAKVRRGVARRVVRLAVEFQWHPDSRQAVWAAYRERFTIDPLTLLILGAIINLIVQLVLRWWWDDPMVRGPLLREWRVQLEQAEWEPC